MLHISQGLPNQTVMGASGAYARKTHTTMRHRKQQTHLMQNIKSANMFQTHTSGQSWSILHTSGQSCFKHILLVNSSHFWSIPHTSGQSLLVDASQVTPAISGQSFTLLIVLSHFCQSRLVNP